MCSKLRVLGNLWNGETEKSFVKLCNPGTSCCWHYRCTSRCFIKASSTSKIIFQSSRTDVSFEMLFYPSITSFMTWQNKICSKIDVGYKIHGNPFSTELVTPFLFIWILSFFEHDCAKNALLSCWLFFARFVSTPSLFGTAMSSLENAK